MTYFSNNYEIKYTLNNNCASVCCAPETFSKLLQTIACRNIDILFKDLIKHVRCIKQIYLSYIREIVIEYI